MSAPEENVTEKQEIDQIWLMRPCEMYYDEYTDCSSLRGQFNHHYIYGHQVDCSKWKEDHENCLKYRKTPSPEFASKIIEHELERQRQRLQDAKGNDIWTYRKSPPAEWTRPLPGWSETHENTILSQAQDAKDRGLTLSSATSTSCVIL